MWHLAEMLKLRHAADEEALIGVGANLADVDPTRSC